MGTPGFPDHCDVLLLRPSSDVAHSRAIYDEGYWPKERRGWPVVVGFFLVVLACAGALRLARGSVRYRPGLRRGVLYLDGGGHSVEYSFGNRRFYCGSTPAGDWSRGGISSQFVGSS